MQINLIQLERTVETAKVKAASHPAWLRAIEKAAEQLISNPYISEQDNGLLILGTTGNIYHSNGTCQCEASRRGMACWHRAAAQLVKRYNEAETATQGVSRTAHPLAGALVKSQGRAMVVDGWTV
jgi:hypothetical protein